MSEETTKERILIAAEALMLKKSYHSVGLKQILDEVKVPKGSFYHYFESKEQFGVEMLKHYMGEAGVWKRSLLLPGGEHAAPLKRLFAYLDETIRIIESAPGQFPCLALKLAAEVSDHCEPMRATIAAGFQDWISIYKEVLDEAVIRKLLPQETDTASEAQIIHDLWSGAAYRSVAYSDAEPVRHAVDHIKAKINSMTQ